MAYTTIRILAGDLHKSLKQTFDDADISFSQVVHWAQFFVNKYVQRSIQSIDSGLYLSIFPDVPVQEFVANVQPNEVKGRKYILLPDSIHDLDDDGGIKYISYSDKEGACAPGFTGKRFTRTTPTKARRLYMNVYEVPSPQNPYFYRVRNNTYLLGIEEINVKYVEVGLYTTFDPFSACDLDAELWMDEAQIAYVFKSVVDIGRFIMLIPSDTLNEGSNTENAAETPSQRLVGLNAEANQEQPQSE